MKMFVMIVALVVAALTIAAMVGCADNSGPAKHDLRGPGPLKNYGQTV